MIPSSTSANTATRPARHAGGKMIVSPETAQICYQAGNMLAFLGGGIVFGFLLGISTHFFFKKNVVE